MSITQCVAILFLTLAAGSCSDRRSVAPLAPSPVPQLAPQPAPTPNAGGVHGKVVDTADRPIVGAIVEVLDGAQAGMSATSGVTGEFMFPWPFDDTTLFRATKKGYIAATQSWKRGSPDHPWLLFYLGVLVPPVNLAGDYTVSFIADTACAVALPVELRTRTYAATMTAVPPSSIYQETHVTKSRSAGLSLTPITTGSRLPLLGITSHSGSVTSTSSSNSPRTPTSRSAVRRQLPSGHHRYPRSRLHSTGSSIITPSRTHGANRRNIN